MLNFVRDLFYDRKRARTGTFKINDLRQSAIESPYTFFIPGPEQIAALRPGIIVKLIFESVPPSYYHGAERMWVIITKTDGTDFEGTLDNAPSDIPQMSLGQSIQFNAHHIASILWETDEDKERFVNTDVEDKMFSRCLVEDCVLYDGVPIGFIYREEPETREDQQFVDTGWRIRGIMASATDEEIDARKMSFVAIGAVLNRDDSVLHLLGEPVGSAFERDSSYAPYLPAENVTSPDDEEI